jgi:hypothetical protein
MMAVMDDSNSGLLSRLRLTDPVRARRPANVVGLVLAFASGLSLAFLDGGSRALVLAVAWLLLIPTALVLGWAAAFFIEHGVGVRRAVAELCAGSLAGIGSCALLSVQPDDVVTTIVVALAGIILYGSVFRALAAGVALGLGRGGQYLARRIQSVDDDGW